MLQTMERFFESAEASRANWTQTLQLLRLLIVITSASFKLSNSQPIVQEESSRRKPSTWAASLKRPDLGEIWLAKPALSKQFVYLEIYLEI